MCLVRPTRGVRALELLAEPDLGLSVQVLQEFYHQATRRSRQGRLTPEQALTFLERFASSRFSN